MLSQGGLSPPSALGSSLLLPRPWAALLRLLLQQKVPAQTLKKLAGPVILGEEDVSTPLCGNNRETCTL